MYISNNSRSLGAITQTSWADKSLAFALQAKADLEDLKRDPVGVVLKKTKFPETELLAGALKRGAPVGDAAALTIKALNDGKLNPQEAQALANLAKGYLPATTGTAQGDAVRDLAVGLVDGRMSQGEAQSIAAGAGAAAGAICGPAAVACSIGFSFAASAVTGAAYKLITGTYKKARRAANKAEDYCREVNIAWANTVSELVESYSQTVIPAGGHPSGVSTRAIVEEHLLKAGAVKPPSNCDLPRVCGTLEWKNCNKASTVQGKAAAMTRAAAISLQSLETVAPRLLASYADIAAADRVKKAIESQLAAQHTTEANAMLEKIRGTADRQQAAREKATIDLYKSVRARNIAIFAITGACVAGSALLIVKGRKK